MQEIQITFAPRHHQLTNAQVWTADGQWLVYDLRQQQSVFDGSRIERVNVVDGRVEILYQAEHGAFVGVVTASPTLPERYVCIHSPEYPDQQWQYDFHHRRGVIIEDNRATTMDALDITPPFTPGALRGGSHVHMFSPEGDRISFTYNDHVMHQLSAEQDLRNVGVAVPAGPVQVVADHPREYSGSHFCVLVSDTTPNPIAGSDQINRAYEESWVGIRGYQTAEGHWQRWALAFIGDTLNQAGLIVPEVFIVDLPEQDSEFSKSGSRPLTGTILQLPAPPAGVRQRRLTYTQGLARQPRHWLKSAPDGSAIGFLMADQNDIIQLWTVPPTGGDICQVTFLEHSIQSVFSWHPQGKHLAFICNNQLMLWDIEAGKSMALTAFSLVAPCAEAVVWSPNGEAIAFMREIRGYRQLCVVKEIFLS